MPKLWIKLLTSVISPMQQDGVFWQWVCLCDSWSFEFHILCTCYFNWIQSLRWISLDIAACQSNYATLIENLRNMGHTMTNKCTLTTDYFRVFRTSNKYCSQTGEELSVHWNKTKINNNSLLSFYNFINIYFYIYERNMPSVTIDDQLTNS